uniref:Uncharacterized protein n=1 Tax=Hucho hucho TaxID=62062 RepID=A0A4W5PAQ0_9TELE
MPCVYKCKTSRAAKEVREGNKFMRAARYIDKKENKHVPMRKRGYDRVAEAHKVLSDDMVSELAKHIKNSTDQCHGLSSLKCRELACKLAYRNNTPVLDNWSRNGRVSDIEQRSTVYLNVECPPELLPDNLFVHFYSISCLQRCFREFGSTSNRPRN